MSNELADRLEMVRVRMIRAGMMNDAILVDEAIAALRAEPVAVDVIKDHIADLQRCVPILVEKGMQETADEFSKAAAELSAAILYAAPSRETAKPEAEPEFLIPGPPQSERPTFGEDKEWDSRRSAAHEPFVKRAAEPALSAEQIEVMRVLLIKVGLNPALCDMALSSMTAREEQTPCCGKFATCQSACTLRGRDEGIEAAAKAAHESLRDIDRAHAEIAYSAASALKGASHD